jgi:chromosome segregation ATPase
MGELRDAARAEHQANSGAGPIRITRVGQSKAPAAAQLTDDVARLATELAQAHDERERLTAALDDTEAERDSLATRVGELDVQLTAAEATVRRQSTEILAAADELAKAGRDRNQARARATAIHNLLNHARADLGAERAEYDDAIQSRDFAQRRLDHFSADHVAREAALADDIAKAREQVRKTVAEKGSRGFRRSKARERRAAALATLVALERVAGRQP